MKRTLVFGLLAAGLLGAHITFAQRNADTPVIVPSASSGEVTSAEIDRMAMEAKDTGERLIVVTHLGTGETSSRLELVRLQATRQYVAQKSFDSRNTVFARGERIAGPGRIEFYLGGHLRLVVLARRNKMPNLTCCDDYVTPSVARKSRRHS